LSANAVLDSYRPKRYNHERFGRHQEVLVRCFIRAALLVVTSLAAAQQPSPSGIDVKSRMEEGIAAFRAHDYKRALSIFNEVTAADPNNIMAHNLAGNCSMDIRDFPAAIQSFQRALQIQPDQPQNLAGLVQSYAQAGMTKERDATLEHLHELSKAGRLPENFSYVFDSFAVGDRSVLVTEFPQLSGQFHFRYHFNVYDATGKFVSRVALESDDGDQIEWAKQHPKEAAAGGRMFSLDGYRSASGRFTHSGYKFYDDGEPPYDRVRADVEKILAGAIKPAGATTTASPPQPSPSQSPKP
jgi:tetratricopeptide (TPR) repeat protein